LVKGSWAVKLDLKDAYFHIGVHPSLCPFLRHKVGSQIWEYRSGPFGLNIMPEIFQKVMRTFECKWHKKGIQAFIYLDDILILGTTQKILEKHLQLVVQDLTDSGFKLNLKKSVLQPTQQVHHLGFLLDFQEGKVKLAPQKMKGVRRELGKFITKSQMSKRQISAILGQVRANLLALPFLRAFTSEMVQFLKQRSQDPWDTQYPVPQVVKKELIEVRKILEGWEGRPFPTKATRILHSDSSTLGWGGLDIQSGEKIQDFWRQQKDLHINKKELLAAISTVQSLARGGETVELNVDNQVLFHYLNKGGGRKGPFNALLQPFFSWLMAKKYHFTSEMGPLCSVSSRSNKSLDAGQRRLHSGQQSFPNNKEIFPGKNISGSGPLCITWKSKASKVCQQVATLGGTRRGCSSSPTGQVRGPGVLLQPPLEHHQPIFAKTKGIPQPQFFAGSPLLGFSHLVAPINKNEGPQLQNAPDSPLQGTIRELLGRKNASPPVGTSLHSLLRQILERRQVQSSTVSDFFARNPSISRYESAFRLLWEVLKLQGVDPPSASLEQVADSIIQIFKISPSQARNAYSAMLLIPGWGNLRFVSLLGPYKRLWNLNVEKYGTFYDPWPILLHLAGRSMVELLQDVELLRTQLILSCRFLCLYRSSDLANLKRTTSVLQDSLFIKIRRKGQKFPKWEKVVSLPDSPQISPAHLLQAYVKATARQGKPGGPVLLSLKPPFKPLTADRVGSLTKQSLLFFGIPAVFGAHSTRGAGVNLMKRLGLSSEQVCEIGQ
jgi:hypothetical protein